MKPNADVAVGNVTFAQNRPIAVFAGPCQMESRAHALEMASGLKEICQSLRTDGAQIEKQAGAEIKDRVKNLQAGIAVNETKALGVLGEDQNACYSGILMNVQTPTGETRLILGVYAMGVLNGRLIFLYRFAANPPAGAVDSMVQLQQQLMRDHVALNNQRR